jgi:hypothetical protein
MMIENKVLRIYKQRERKWRMEKDNMMKSFIHCGRHHVLLTYFMVQDILWKADSYSACENNSLISLWKPKVHYRVHTKARHWTLSWASRIHPVRSIDKYLPKVHLNVILPPTPRPFSGRTSQPKPCKHLSPPPCVPRVPPTSSSLI